MTKEQALIYTAGIIDGEGSVLLNRVHSNCNRSPVVSVASTTKEILDFLKECFGGTIVSKKVYRETHKSSWEWRLGTNASIELLTQVEPFLLEPKKRARAHHIVQNYKRVTRPNGRYTPEQMEEKLKFEEDFFLL